MVLANIMQVNIFTDGACRGNPGPGGWAAILRYDDQEKIISGYEEYTTNNRMELQAVIKALLQIKRPCNIAVFSDSKYVCQGMTQWVINWQKKGWQTANKQPVKNQDLWELMVNLVKPHVIAWNWVKGHAGHVENEMADALANKAIDQKILYIE